MTLGSTFLWAVLAGALLGALLTATAGG